jgi:hypothetical protein
MGGLVDIAAGYWFLAASSATTKITPNTELYACMNDECCAAYDGIRVRCNVEKGYYGPICGGCDRDNEQGAGFFTRSGSGCAQCWSPELSWLAFLAIGFGLVLAMVFLVAQHNFAAPKGEYGATIQKIAFSHLQMLGVLGKELSDDVPQRFLLLCEDAFNQLRRNAHLLLALFILMVPAGMPELREASDVGYMHRMLLLHLDDAEAGQEFRGMVTASLKDTFRQIDNAIHQYVHRV